MNQLAPKKSLNKAFLKLKINRNDLENFSKNLKQLLTNINGNESEEFHKNLVTEFLKNTYYSPNYFINTKGRNDLVIHNGKDGNTPVGVILELKKPAHKFVGVNGRSPLHNQKALQELLLYYLRERITANNLEIKHLIVTNIYQWFIFDAQIFDKLFAQNKQLVQQFIDFENRILAIKTTDLFYQEIAQKAIALVENELTFTYFDLHPHPPTHHQPKGEEEIDIETRLPSPSGRGVGGEGDSRLPSPSGRGVGGEGDLITLYKIFSPEHLLKLSFVNDSNSLDKNFYNELLYIIGLTEVKQGSKKLIQREKITNRNKGSLLENVITQLKSLSKLHNIENAQEYGETEEEQLFNLGLELVITWVNRILFLKLLESQLINYNCRDNNIFTYSFLNLEKIRNYQELNSLFFRILAVKNSDRDEDIRGNFAYIPYLNSSLFEVSDIENKTIVISNLSEEKISLFSATVLKDRNGKKRTGNINSLSYLFEFLNRYDFGDIPPLVKGGLGGVIKEDNKTLINASVLGLIFEKINGYQDGSFFTPSFITMYMCRETIHRAILHKFNEIKGWNCENLSQLYDQITDKKEANSIINSIKICDPAVGSGHFLVSALNEIIAIKSELKILLDKEGKTLRDYDIEVVNDELIITDDDGDLFQYNPQSKESQRIQETLFHEKQHIIENCLFGVDINPNSVKICRLRLWIELLKNAYYIPLPQGEGRMLPSPPAPLPQGEGRMLPSPPATLPQGEGRMLPSPPATLPQGEGIMLQTLPNIDINIKCGNSLISKFKLDSDLKKVLKESQSNLASYKNAVKTYKNTTNKQEKRELLRLINNLKWTFKDTLAESNPKKTKLRKLAGELYNLENQISLFEETKTEKKQREKQINKLNNEIDKLKNELEEIETGTIYQKAFEWRFEFPEVLDDEGNFVGFDVIIGNPPYGVSLTKKERDFLIINEGKVPDFEIYYWFINKAHSLLGKFGRLSYIIPNSILFNVFAQNYRLELFKNWNFEEILDCTDINIFSEATIRNVIINLIKSKNGQGLYYKNTDKITNFQELISRYLLYIEKDLVIENNQNWSLLFKLKKDVLNLITKIKINSQPLSNLFSEISQGLIAYDKYKNQSEEIIKNRIFHSNKKLNDNYKPWLYGEDVTKYQVKWNGKEYLNYCDQIANPRQPKYFIGKRILVREITNPSIFAALTTEELYNDPAIINIIKPEQQILSLECLLGILNSKFATFYHFNSSPKATKGSFPKILVYDINNFPLPKVINQNLASIICQKVTQRITFNPNRNTSELERKIDLLVYELYGLTEEEINLIENT